MDAFKLAGEMWKQMNEEAKAPYEKMSQEDKVREEKQKAELAKKGYYTLTNGTKSTDPENAQLLKKKKKSKKITGHTLKGHDDSDSDGPYVEPKIAKSKEVKPKAKKEQKEQKEQKEPKAKKEQEPEPKKQKGKEKAKK